MKSLFDDATVRECLRALRHLGIRIASRPETVALRSGVDVARARLVAADDAWQECVDARVTLNAELDYAEWLEGRAVLDLSRDVLALVRGRRDDPRWKALFPVAPSRSVGRTSLARHTAYVRVVYDVLTTSRELAELSARHRAVLERHRAAVEELIRRRDLAAVAEQRALGVRDEAVAAAKLAYNNMALQLRMLFPGQRRFVETFFPKISRRPAAPEGTSVEMAAK